MTCTNCGAEVPDGKKFCTQCGAKVEASKAREAFERGMAAVEAKDYDTAIAEFTEAIRLDPDNEENIKEALTVAQKLKAQDREIAELQALAEAAERGKEALDKGDYDSAIAAFSEAIKLQPDKGAWYNKRGNAYYRKDDYGKAVADYEQAVKLDPNEEVFKNNLAVAAKAAELKKQIAEMEALTEASERGKEALDKGDYDAAIAAFSEVIKLEPDNGSFYNARGNAYYDKGDYGKAVADFEQAIKLEPDKVGLYNMRGNAYYAKGDYDKAIADYEQAVKLDPNQEVFKNNLAGAQAAKASQVAATEAPQEQDAAAEAIARGAKALANGDYDAAIAASNELIKLEPDNGFWYNVRAQAYYGKKEYDKAIADCEQAIKLNPNYEGLKKNLAELQAAKASAASVKFCGECGAQLTPGKKFCGDCGAVVK